MTLPELLEKVGADNLSFQMLNQSMTNITSGKHGSKVTFSTGAINPTNVATNTGPVGIVVWCDRDAWTKAVKK